MSITHRPAAVLVAGTFLLAACGGGSDAGTSDAGTSDTAIAIGSSERVDGTGAGAVFNDADVTFAQGMMPHHSQAVEMASIALDPASDASPEVVALATAVEATQDPEIDTMTGWLEAWGQPLAAPDMDGADHTGMDDMDHSGTDDMDHTGTDDMDHSGTDGMDGIDGMDGMMTEQEMVDLADLSGPEFDRAWLTTMIAHHEGAIAQAETVQAAGSDPQVRALADQIIAAQQAEIVEMRALLAG